MENTMFRPLSLMLALVCANPSLAQEGKPPVTLGPKVIEQTTSVINTDTGNVKYRVPFKYDNVTLKDYDVTTSHFGVNIKDGSHVTIDGGTWRHNGSPEKISASFAVGVGTPSSTLTLQNVHAIGSYDPAKNVKTEFANVDNVMAAQRTYLTIIGGEFEKAWDASIDTKGETKLFGNVVCRDSRVCLKAWNHTVAQPDSVLFSYGSRDGDVACLSSSAGKCDVFLPMLEVHNSNPSGLLVGFQGPGTVHIAACRLYVPESYRVSWVKRGVKGQTLILGPTCAKDGKVVVYKEPVGVRLDLGEILVDKNGGGVRLTTTATIARLNATLKAKGSAIVLKFGDVVRNVGGTEYEFVTN
jgi:hypothetical protein